MERSQVEKKLYDATKHFYRPSDSDLAAIVDGAPVTRPAADRIDIAFPSETTDEAL